MQSDITSYGLPSDLRNNFCLDLNLSFIAGQSSLVRELTFPNLWICPWFFLQPVGKLDSMHWLLYQNCLESYVPLQQLKLSRALSVRGSWGWENLGAHETWTLKQTKTKWKTDKHIQNIMVKRRSYCICNSILFL